MALRCGDSNSRSVFDPDEGHAAGWVEQHGAVFVSYPGQCYECHGPDLGGGISGLGCFVGGSGGAACHGSAVFHGEGWGDPEAHGRAAKAAPAGGNGFSACRTCHGGDFDGGIIRISCFLPECHGVPAPHAPSPWRGVPVTHTDTDVGNAPVCADCHLGESGVPVPPGTPVGCFNNTLCHFTEVSHSPGWFTDHALSARVEFASCGTDSCHGSDYTGGESGVSCFACHLGGPEPGAGIMHPDRWGDPEGQHEPYLGALGKDATGCSPARSGAAIYCHGDGLPTVPPGVINAPPNLSWYDTVPPAFVTCYDCHGKKWTAP